MSALFEQWHGLNRLGGRRIPKPELAVSHDQVRERGFFGALHDSYLLDTAAGQLTIAAATANSMDVNWSPITRRVVDGYDPFLHDDLTGFEQYADEFVDSTSPEETRYIKQMIQNNLDLRHNVEDFGLTRFAAGILDPINLVPVGRATGLGFIGGAKAVAIPGTATLGVAEAVRHAIDPTSTYMETVTNVMGGALFMGLMGGAVGKIDPTKRMSVDDAFKSLVPPKGQTGMFAGLPFFKEGSLSKAFERINETLNLDLGHRGMALSDTVDTSKFSVKTEVGKAGETDAAQVSSFIDQGKAQDGETLVTVSHEEHGAVIYGVVEKGRVRVMASGLPESLQHKGIGTAAYKQLIQWASDNGRIVVSDTKVSKSASGVYKKLGDEGYNVKENENVEFDGAGDRTSLDGEPLFEVRPVLEGKLPEEILSEISQTKAARSTARARLEEISADVKALREELPNKKKAGGARTKHIEKIKKAEKELKQAQGMVRALDSAVEDLNSKAALALDEKIVKDWDLLPTGYNKILGKLNEFPWWRLIRTDLRTMAPELAAEVQLYAFRMAGTPGLNNIGNRLGHTSGVSVEMAAYLHHGKFAVAANEVNRIYMKYLGYGETTNNFRTYVVSATQGVRSRLESKAGIGDGTTNRDGKLTKREFHKQVTIAMTKNGDHAESAVREAAKIWIKVVDEIGDEARKLGITSTQRNVKRKIARLEKELKGLEELQDDHLTAFGRERGSVEDLKVVEDAVRDEIKRLKTLGDGFENSMPAIIPDHMVKLKDGLNVVRISDDMVPGRNLVDATGVNTKSKVEVLKNPTRESLARWGGRENPQVRFVVDGNGDLYVWDANEMLHETFRQAVATSQHRNAFFDITVPANKLFDEFGDSLKTKMFAGAEVDDIPYPRVITDEIESTPYYKELHELAKKQATERLEVLEELDPFVLQQTIDDVHANLFQMYDRLAAYEKVERGGIGEEGYIHRIWLQDEVRAKEKELKEYLFKELGETTKEGTQYVRIGDDVYEIEASDPDVIWGRVEEAYNSILKEANLGGDAQFISGAETSKRDYLEARRDKILEQLDYVSPDHEDLSRLAVIQRKLRRIEKGTEQSGGGGALIDRRLDLDDAVLIELGVIESDVEAWVGHYVVRMAPMIETARKFGDMKADAHINNLMERIHRRAIDEEDPVKKEKLEKEAADLHRAMTDLRDIVQGTYQIPDDPSAITGRFLRLLRNINIPATMGRSVIAAFGDTGNIVISQGFLRTFRHGLEKFKSGLTDGNIKLIDREVELAGAVTEVLLGMRYYQLTELGPQVGAMTKFERGVSRMAQRFFLHNLLGPWTDMARRFSGGLAQSEIISNSLLWRDGKLSADMQEKMGRLGINKAQAEQFANEWERSGGAKHREMYIASTEDWTSEEAKRVFRAALNTEIMRMVPTPGAVDKPKTLLKSEWWKVVGQYRGFSIGATHRIMGAAVHTKGKSKYAGIASMIGIAFMSDLLLRRPDYISMPLEQQILRAVELSAVTGIILDLNDTVERATGGGFGLRPAIGMDIRERNPNWANQLGTIGAVPNQWLTLIHAFTAEDATTNDKARAVRYMVPYNNLLWWNDFVTRMQRATVNEIEERQ